MDWLTNLWISSLIFVPFLGTLFILFIPNYEKLLRKRVSLSIVGACATILLRNTFFLFKDTLTAVDLTLFHPLGFTTSFFFRLDYLSCLGLTYLLIGIFFLFYCSPGLQTNTETDTNSETLFILGLSSAGILAGNFAFTILVQYAVIMSLFGVNLRSGSAYRSSSTLTAGIFFTFIDLSAFFAWSFKSDILKVADPDFFTIFLILPFLTRLCVPFFTPWSRLFFSNSTIETTALYLASSFVIGGIGLARLQFHNPFLVTFVSIAALFAGLLSFADKTLKDFLMRIVSVAGCLATVVLVSNNSNKSSLETVIFLGTLSSIIITALFIQNSLNNNQNDLFQGRLHYLWMASITLILGIPYLGVGMTIWNILPLSSWTWFLVLGLFCFSLSKNIRMVLLTPIASKGQTHRDGPSANTMNTWICILIVIATSISFKLLFSQAV